MSNKNKTNNLILAAMFLALSLIIPFITGQIPQIGNMLCPMHFPILLCGFIVGPFYGCIIGFVAPLLRFVLFGMPPIIPLGIAMAFELATYGFVSGLLYQKMKKSTLNTYIVLLIAMFIGRIVWGLVRILLVGVTNSSFGFSIFMAEAFINAIPGIVLQILIIPILVNTFQKYKK